MNREDTNDSDTAGESFDPSPPTYMLRHGATLLGRSKDRKAQGDSTADRLGAIHDGLFTDKQVFTTVGPLEAEDGGTHGVNRRRRSRRGVGNRGQIADGGHDGIEGVSKERKCKQGQPESFVDIHHLMARAKLFFAVDPKGSHRGLGEFTVYIYHISVLDGTDDSSPTKGDHTSPPTQE